MAAWLAPLPLAMGQRPELERSEAQKKKQNKNVNFANFSKKYFGLFGLFGAFLLKKTFGVFFIFPMRCGALIRLARLGSALPAVLVALLLRSKPQKSGPWVQWDQRWGSSFVQLTGQSCVCIDVWRWYKICMEDFNIFDGSPLWMFSNAAASSFSCNKFGLHRCTRSCLSLYKEILGFEHPKHAEVQQRRRLEKLLSVRYSFPIVVWSISLRLHNFRHYPT